MLRARTAAIMRSWKSPTCRGTAGSSGPVSVGSSRYDGSLPLSRDHARNEFNHMPSGGVLKFQRILQLRPDCNRTDQMIAFGKTACGARIL